MRRSIRFDALNKLLLVLAVILMVISRTPTMYIFTGVLLALFMIRAFSKDDYARHRENERFTQFIARVKARFTSKRGQRVRPVRPVHTGQDAGQAQQQASNGKPQKPKADKEHKIYKCPNCKTYLRVPRGKGKILITCNSCGHKFNKKT